MKFQITRKLIGVLLLSIVIAWLTIATHTWFAKLQNGVTIKLSGWAANPVEQSSLTKVLADFNVKYPQIKVEYEVIDNGYMDKIKAWLKVSNDQNTNDSYKILKGKNAPDVFYLDALYAPLLIEKEVLWPLDKYIKSESNFDKDDFEKKLIESFQSKDKKNTYGLPKDYSTLALFYDRQALKSAVLEHPPENWQELRDYSQALTTKDFTGKIKRSGFGESAQLSRQAYKISTDGKIIKEDKESFTFSQKEWWKELDTIVKQYRQDRTSAQNSDFGTSSESDMLGQKKVAMTIEGNWAIPYLQKKYPQLDFATVEVPTIKNKPGTMVFTVAYAMNKASQHKDEAWKLISYLTGKEGMKKWSKSGFALPARKSVAKTLELEKDPLRSPFVAGVKYATPWQLGQYPDIIVNNFNKQFQSVMSGEQRLKEAMEKIQKEANSQIRKKLNS